MKTLFILSVLFSFLFYIPSIRGDLACCEQYNLKDAGVIITQENIDFEHNLEERGAKLQTANHGTFDIKILRGPRRVEILNFITEDEIKTSIELFDSFTEQDYDIVYPGFDNVRGPQQFYPTKALYRSAMYESGEMTPQEIKRIYEENMRLERLNKFYFMLLERTIDAAQAFFNESQLVLKDSFLVRRYQPGNIQPIRYAGCNITNWGHHPHVDRCTLTLDDVNGRTCIPYSLLPVEFSCMIYLNDVDGGELVFLNMPQGKDALVQTMEDRVKEMNGGKSGGGDSWRHRSLRHNNETVSGITNFAAESYVPIYELPKDLSKDEIKILKKRKLAEVKKRKFDIGGEDIRQYFKPVTTDYVSTKRGNLMCFKSTPENLHGVNEIRNGVRKNISFFLATKKLYDQWAKTGRIQREQREQQQRGGGGGQYGSSSQQQQPPQEQKTSSSRSSNSKSTGSKKSGTKSSGHKGHSRE